MIAEQTAIGVPPWVVGVAVTLLIPVVCVGFSWFTAREGKRRQK